MLKPDLPRCCVVIPTYNEAAHLPVLLPAVFEQQRAISSHELWVLVADDNSPDGTARLLDELCRSYPRLRAVPGPRFGLGAAYLRGFAYALEKLHSALVVQMDADLQHDPASLPELVSRCQHGVAAVIGSRFVPGAATPSFSRRRRATSRLGGWLIRRLTGLPQLTDYTSGYRCLNAQLLAPILARCQRRDLATRGFAFQSTLIAEMLLTGAPVLEVPITFAPRRYGRSKLGGRDVVEFALNLRRLRRRCRRAQPAPSTRPR